MIPRFSNPHLLPRVTQIVSRSEIYASSNNDPNESSEYYSDLSNRLNKCLEHALSQPDLEANSRKRKREDLEGFVSNSESSEEPILFRLVSSALPPLPISVLPPPPPPPMTREPDAEDSEEQALLRKQHAEAASVEAATILHESKADNRLSQKFDKITKPLRHLCAASDCSQINIMIIRKLQQPRKTRPPVPLSNLSQYPYVPDISTISLPPVQSRMMDFPVVDAEDAGATPSVASKRCRPRRRRRDPQTRERPPPQFWRPNPAWIGKCRGYAYGYPSNLACRLGTESWKYKRDSMKKAVY